jgi:hypothetical protein
MSNLYQDAILDAKALRASAMANAKAALEEAFEPKIQEMIAKHLSEEEEVDMEEDYGMEEEGKEMEEEGKMHGDDHKMEEAEDINEAELEEILNQLEEMSAPKEESLNEAEDDETEEEETEEEEEGEEEGNDTAEGEEEVGDDTKIIDITLGDLKQVIQSLMPGIEPMPAAAEEPTADSEAEAEVSLDEILDELEAEGANDIGKYNADDVQSADLQGDETFQREEEGLEEKKHKLKKPYSKLHNKGAEAADAKNGAEFSGTETDIAYSKKAVKESNELEEAKATIETLRKDLQEVNLLNAKYLYMNKLFKSKSLSESQKLKVINTLDNATSVKEVKISYELMKESFETKKGQLKESVGFASKPAGVAPNANIVEADTFINRWQKLAGIK